MFQATLMASNRLTGARDAASIDRGLPVVHSGPDQRAEPCAVLDDVQQDPHRRRQGDHEQPVRRVGEAAQPHTLREDGGDRDRARVATEDRETPVGDHQRDADGEQDLGQLLAAHPTEEDALGRQPEHGRRGHTGEDRHQEVARSREGGDADIAADEIEGPVRKVNDLHQAEHEGDPLASRKSNAPKLSPFSACSSSSSTGIARNGQGSLLRVWVQEDCTVCSGSLYVGRGMCQGSPTRWISGHAEGRLVRHDRPLPAPHRVGRVAASRMVPLARR
jgi:hypothetical protein